MRSTRLYPVSLRIEGRPCLVVGGGAVALRNTPLALKWLEAAPDPQPALSLIRDAFDMLEEDFEEERFFVTVRRGYWQAADGSPARKVAAALIQTLEF